MIRIQYIVVIEIHDPNVVLTGVEVDYIFEPFERMISSRAEAMAEALRRSNAFAGMDVQVSFASQCEGV